MSNLACDKWSIIGDGDLYYWLDVDEWKMSYFCKLHEGDE